MMKCLWNGAHLLKVASVLSDALMRCLQRGVCLRADETKAFSPRETHDVLAPMPPLGQVYAQYYPGVFLRQDDCNLCCSLLGLLATTYVQARQHGAIGRAWTVLSL